ncbi:hypothetical protein BOW53_09640 [Solemya pervernicosa gill symbiont]|uniref:DUF218 domain-containing protein n=2 Tax=Gammaproteobacteria incertae sedis TaxID=118884 RepID=A0A1T2L4G1_9GAMM|nr:YdcF family protein [Candidatus Reidiella endopervernicosa]OOZ39920.1 hypothetical protein BOW53_09640 [Solemya pervernicosa gill symbiont]QKQ25973.1 YdcF family protein [Candidatus Reidiella endopervernicosa]
MDILFSRTLELLVYPPASSLVFIMLGAIFLLTKKTSLAILTTSFAVVTLYFASIPFTTEVMSDMLERTPPVTPELIAEKRPQAIVVLGGGRYWNAPEYGGNDVSGDGGLERVRYAAYLYRNTKLPIALIGGDGLKTGTSEAALMQHTLEQEYIVPVRWTDGRSQHTFDNARYAHEVLTGSGIERILLVTHARHMPRAQKAFEDTGLIVIPAPTAYSTPGPTQSGLRAWLPNARTLTQNNAGLHELLGMVWYRIFH